MSSTDQILKILKKTAIGSLVGGACNAIASTVSGITGSGVLAANGYGNYRTDEAITMGYIGGIVSGAAEGAIFGAQSGSGLFDFPLNAATVLAASTGSVFFYATQQVINGMVGYALYHADNIQMVFKEAVTNFAVGGALTALPFGLGVFSVGYLMIKLVQHQNDLTNLPQEVQSNTLQQSAPTQPIEEAELGNLPQFSTNRSETAPRVFTPVQSLHEPVRIETPQELEVFNSSYESEGSRDSPFSYSRA